MSNLPTISKGLPFDVPIGGKFPQIMPAPSRVIYDTSAGSQYGNIYTSWANVVIVAGLFSGPVEIYVRNDSVIPVGSYTMPTSWYLTTDSFGMTVPSGVYFNNSPLELKAEGNAPIFFQESGSGSTFTLSNPLMLITGCALSLGTNGKLINGVSGNNLTLRNVQATTIGQLLMTGSSNTVVALENTTLQNNILPNSMLIQFDATSHPNSQNGNLGIALASITNPTVVYNSSGPAGGNVYTSLTLASDALFVNKGPRTLAWRAGSIVTITSGLFDTGPECEWNGAAIEAVNGTSFVTFSGSAAIFTTPPTKLTDINVHNTVNTVPIIYDLKGGNWQLELVNCTMIGHGISSPLYPVIQFNDSVGNGSVLIRMSGESSLHGAIGFQTGVDITAQVNLFDLSNLGQFTSGDTGSVSVYYESSAARSDPRDPIQFVAGSPATLGDLYFAPGSGAANLGNVTAFINESDLVSAIESIQQPISVWYDFSYQVGNTYTSTQPLGAYGTTMRGYNQYSDTLQTTFVIDGYATPEWEPPYEIIDIGISIENFGIGNTPFATSPSHISLSGSTTVSSTDGSGFIEASSQNPATWMTLRNEAALISAGLILVDDTATLNVTLEDSASLSVPDIFTITGSGAVNISINSPGVFIDPSYFSAPNVTVTHGYAVGQGSGVLVFDQTQPATGNVYSDFGLLSAAAVTENGPVTIFFQNSPTILAGTYDFGTRAQFSITMGSSLVLNDGVIFTNLPIAVYSSVGETIANGIYSAAYAANISGVFNSAAPFTVGSGSIVFTNINFITGGNSYLIDSSAFGSGIVTCNGCRFLPAFGDGYCLNLGGNTLNLLGSYVGGGGTPNCIVMDQGAIVSSQKTTILADTITDISGLSVVVFADVSSIGLINTSQLGCTGGVISVSLTDDLPGVIPYDTTFQPGGIGGPDLYVTEAALNSALASMTSSNRVYLDVSALGNFHFDMTQNWDLGQHATLIGLFFEGYPPSLFTEGTFNFTTPLVGVKDLTIYSGNGTVPIFPALVGSQAFFRLSGYAFVQCGSDSPLFNLTDTSLLTLSIDDYAEIGDGSNPVITVDATSILNVNVNSMGYDFNNFTYAIQAGAITVTPGGSVFIYCQYEAQIDPSYFSMSGVTVTVGESSSPPETLVFKPGGTAGGNVFTTEASLATATQTLNGAPYSIFFDLSISGSPYTFATVGTLNLAPNGTWTDAGRAYGVVFANSTVLANAPVVVDGALALSITQSTPPFPASTVTFQGSTEIVTSNAELFSHGTGICTLKDNANAQGSVPLFIGGPGTFRSLYVYPDASVGANVVHNDIHTHVFPVGVMNANSGGYSRIDPTNYSRMTVGGLFIDFNGVGISSFSAIMSDGGVVLTGGTYYQAHGSTWTALGGGGELPFDTTFQPGGTAGTDVYINEASISSALTTMSSSHQVYVDLSHNGGYPYVLQGNLSLGDNFRLISPLGAAHINSILETAGDYQIIGIVSEIRDMGLQINPSGTNPLFATTQASFRISGSSYMSGSSTAPVFSYTSGAIGTIFIDDAASLGQYTFYVDSTSGIEIYISAPPLYWGNPEVLVAGAITLASGANVYIYCSNEAQIDQSYFSMAGITVSVAEPSFDATFKPGQYGVPNVYSNEASFNGLIRQIASSHHAYLDFSRSSDTFTATQDWTLGLNVSLTGVINQSNGVVPSLAMNGYEFADPLAQIIDVNLANGGFVTPPTELRLDGQTTITSNYVPAGPGGSVNLQSISSLYFDSVNNVMWTSSYANTNLIGFNTATQALVASVNLSAYFHSRTRKVTGDTNYVYIVDPFDATNTYVLIIRKISNTIVGILNVSSFSPRDMTPDGAGGLWVVVRNEGQAGNNVQKFTSSDIASAISTFPTPQLSSGGTFLSGVLGHSICYDADDNQIWVGTHNQTPYEQIYQLDAVSGSTLNVSDVSGIPYPTSFDHFHGLVYYNGFVWAGTGLVGGSPPDGGSILQISPATFPAGGSIVQLLTPGVSTSDPSIDTSTTTVLFGDAGGTSITRINAVASPTIASSITPPSAGEVPIVAAVDNTPNLWIAVDGVTGLYQYTDTVGSEAELTLLTSVSGSMPASGTLFLDLTATATYDLFVGDITVIGDGSHASIAVGATTTLNMYISTYNSNTTLMANAIAITAGGIVNLYISSLEQIDGTYLSLSGVTIHGINSPLINTPYVALGLSSTTPGHNVGAVSIGYSNYGYGIGSVAVGTQNYSDAQGSITIGNSNSASDQACIAMGDGCASSGINSLAMGYYTTSSGYTSTAIGTESQSTGYASLAAGYTCTASQDGSVAIGDTCISEGEGSTAIGYLNGAHQSGCVAIGNTNHSSDVGCVAVGDNNDGYGAGAVAVGAGNSAMGESTVAIGEGNSATSDNDIAIGRGNFCYGDTHCAIAIGINCTSSSAVGGTITIGNACNVQEEHSIAIGYHAATAFNATSSVAIGDNCFVNTNASNSVSIGSLCTSGNGTDNMDGAVSIGNNNSSTDDGCVAIGDSNTATAGTTNNGAVALGYLNTTNSNGAVAIGSGNTAANDGNVAIGDTNTTDFGTGCVAIGISNTADSSSTQGAVAIGSYNITDTDGCVAIGDINTADSSSTQGAIAIGYSNTTDADGCVAIGDNNYANSNETKGAVAIGYRNNTYEDGAVSLGDENNANEMGCVAIGYTNVATAGTANLGAVAIGANNTTNGDGNVAIGDGNNALASLNEGAVAIGYYNSAIDDGSVAIGDTNKPTGIGSIAIGDNNTANETSTVAIGSFNTASYDGSVAIGDGNTANPGVSNQGAIAIGAYNTSDNDGAVAIGNSNGSNTDGSVAIGDLNIAGSSGGLGTVAIGYQNIGDAGGGGGGSQNGATAIGYSNTTSALGAVAIGNNNSSSSDGGVAIGDTNSTDTGLGCVAIGKTNTANSNAESGTVAIGDTCVTDGRGCVALGYESDAISGSTQGAVAIGSQCTTNADGAVAIGNTSTASSISSIAIGGACSAGGNGSVAVGNSNTTDADGCVAIGDSNQASSGGTEGAVAVGYGNATTADGSIAIGDSNFAGALMSDEGTVAIGLSNNTSSQGSVSIGNSNTANGDGAVAIGDLSSSLSDGAVSIGEDCQARADGSVAIGDNCYGEDIGSVGLGYECVAQPYASFASGAGVLISTSENAGQRSHGVIGVDGYFLANDVVLTGTTPGLATGESVNLVTVGTVEFALLPNMVYSLEVRATVTDKVHGNGSQTFIQTASVSVDSFGTVSVINGTNAQQQFGSITASTWTMTLSTVNPTTFRINITSGATTSKLSACGKVTYERVAGS